MLANNDANAVDIEPLERLFPIAASLRVLAKVTVMTTVWLLTMTLLLLVSSAFNRAVASQPQLHSMAQLQQAGRVVITSRLTPIEAVVPLQQVDLYIKISTDTWFAGGTHINAFDVEDTIVLRRKKLASNTTERKDGKTWAVQEWQLTLYPQSVGLIAVPKIAVSVNIADKPGANIKGTLYTQPQSFVVKSSAELLATKGNYIAAPEVTFKQTVTPAVGSELHIGDAVTRTLTIYATDSSAMLFPDFPLYRADMLHGYQGPSESKDKQNRGEFSAKRVYQQTYIVQQSGVLNLPELGFYWWDTATQQVTELNAAGLQWQVLHTPLSFVKAYWWYGVLLLSLLAATVYSLVWLHKRINKQQLPVLMLFSHALLNKRFHRVEQYLYWHHHAKNNEVTFKAKQGLLASAQHKAATVDACQAASEAISTEPLLRLSRTGLVSRWQQRFSQNNPAAESTMFYLLFWRFISNKK